MPAGVDLFTSEHNAPITWEHLLRQTSDWSGTLWGKPDWADRPPRGRRRSSGRSARCTRPARSTNTTTRGSTCWPWRRCTSSKRPLPEVLKVSIMDPIGASSSWHWEAYDNAWVEIDGARMKSVTGGGHFGGGMFINAYDLARFGYLFLQNGKWGGRQLVSEKWIAMASTPGPRTRLRLLQLVPEQPAKRADGTEARFRSRRRRVPRSRSRATASTRSIWTGSTIWSSSCAGSTTTAAWISSSGRCSAAGQ